MPGRLIPLVNGEVYHLYNRGVNKQTIFIQPRDYTRFQKTFYYYKFAGPKVRFSNFNKSNLFKPILNDKLIEVFSYCLMPNHFHFLVKQLKDNGISVFMSQLSNSYTKYLNTKCNRVGSLLQGTYKAVHVESDEQLIHLSRYIHLNQVVSELVKSPNNYKWSSFNEFMDKDYLCSSTEVLSMFPSKEKYGQFVTDQINYGTTLELIKHHLIDDEV